MAHEWRRVAAVIVALVLGATIARGQARVVDVLADQQDVSVWGARVASFVAADDNLVIADISGDGAADLVFGSITEGFVGVFLGPLPAGARRDLLTVAPDILFRDTRSRSFFGQAIRVADVSGDGINDLIVGASRDGREIGEVHVFFGPIAAGTSVTGAPPVADAVIMGLTDADIAGSRVEVGDLDDDGLTDLIVVAPNGWGPGDASTVRGRELYLLFGPLAPGTRQLASEPPDVVIYEARTGWGTQNQALVVADLSGDGVDDLVLTDRTERTASVPGSSGATNVLFGRPRAAWPGVIDLQVTDADITLRTTFAVSAAAQAAAVGDVNADGSPDLLLAFPYASPPARREAGEVRVHFGPLAPGEHVDPIAGALILGADWADYTAEALGVADLTGDGVLEVVLGVGNADGPGNRDGGPSVSVSTGEAAVLLGPIREGELIDLRSDVDVVLTGRGGDDRLGHVLAFGDLSGDGILDLGAGTTHSDGPVGTSRSSAGAAHVLFGPLASACDATMPEMRNLFVVKSAGGVTIEFGAPRPGGDRRASLYGGTIASLHGGAYDHHAVLGGCRLASTSIELPADEAPGIYWLSVANCAALDAGTLEGPLGNSVSSAGIVPRPSSRELGLAACP